MAAVLPAVLATRDLLPMEHLVDNEDTDADVRIRSEQEDRVASVGLVADDPSGQARAGEDFDTSP